MGRRAVIAALALAGAGLVYVAWQGLHHEPPPALPRFGYIDRTGAWAIEPRFFFADDFAQERAAVRMRGGVGFINPWGDLAVPPRFAQAYPFREGLARVMVRR